MSRKSLHINRILTAAAVYLIATPVIHIGADLFLYPLLSSHSENTFTILLFLLVGAVLYVCYRYAYRYSLSLLESEKFRVFMRHAYHRQIERLPTQQKKRIDYAGFLNSMVVVSALILTVLVYVQLDNLLAVFSDPDSLRSWIYPAGLLILIYSVMTTKN